MIQTRGLVKRYGAFTAVNGIDLNIPPGEIYGFLGPNGAGKTSTIMMLLGVIRPTAGEIRLFGEPYARNRLDLRRRIGVVPEKHPRGMWPWITAREYLKLFADLFQVRDAEARIRHLLERVDLADVGNKRIREFSRGMLQKLSISRALLPDPDILFLDEPISGLDPIGIKQVRDLIVSERRQGRAIFISSHQLSEMERICHRVAIIHRGRLMAEDTMASLLGRLAREQEIHVELERLPEGLEAEVRAMEGVLGVEAHGTSLVARFAREGDHRKALSSLLIGKGLVPLQIRERALSLEEAFVTITKENIELLAGGRA